MSDESKNSTLQCTGMDKDHSKGEALEAEPKPNPKKRKRGAPIGNQNAYKHGFYSQHFTRQEVRDFEEMEPLDVHNEIELVRALMRRVLESSNTVSTHTENLDTLRAICLGNFTLSRLIRTQFLKPKDPDDTFRAEILQILAELEQNYPDHFQDANPGMLSQTGF